ncbi:MAG: hypothetical protein H6527_06590 [Actinobacteria bacterium]|nr:hypothetical protein [Actinomycetota bacterium]
MARTNYASGLARQKELGSRPARHRILNRPDLFHAWVAMNDDERKGLAHPADAVFCRYSKTTDWNVGFVSSARSKGDGRPRQLYVDHVHLWGDNGSSMEGTVTGSSLARY